MKLTDLTIVNLLAAFQSPDPTPGGGSASALAGAVGASLLTMVAGLPKPRTETEEDLERLADAGRRCAALSQDLTALIDRDSEAYLDVVSAYRLPKGTDAEKAARAASIQVALKGATNTPLDVIRACAGAIEQAVVVAALGNPSASSDVRVGLELLLAGAIGASANVDINLTSIKDAAYVERLRAEVSELERGVRHEAEAARNRLRAV
jgi:formiminotetrahydrofolate cyclodeaminase